MRVLTDRVAGTAAASVLAPVLASVLALGALGVLLPTSAGASGPARPVPTGAAEAHHGGGEAVLGPAVAYLREADGTVRRIR